MSPRLSHHFHIPYNPSMFSTTTRQKPTASPDNFAHQPRAKDTKNTPAPGAPPRPLWAQENGSFASRRIRSLLHSSSSGLLETLPDTLARRATQKSRPCDVLRAAHGRSKSAAHARPVQRICGTLQLFCIGSGPQRDLQIVSTALGWRPRMRRLPSWRSAPGRARRRAQRRCENASERFGRAPKIVEGSCRTLGIVHARSGLRRRLRLPER